MTESSLKRPFWMHQLVEYLLGGVLVAQGLRSPTPLAPAAAGALLMLNAAIARGPLSAFRVAGRKLHRTLDVVVIAAITLVAAQPWWSIDTGARALMLIVAALMAFVWWQTSFAERARTRTPVSAAGGRSNEIGRLAGRAVGDTINAARRLKKP